MYWLRCLRKWFFKSTHLIIITRVGIITLICVQFVGYHEGFRYPYAVTTSVTIRYLRRSRSTR
jgi:hypothetical protein